MCVAFEDESEPTKPNREMSAVASWQPLKWIWNWILFNIIIEDDDNDDNNKNMKSWNGSDNIWMNGYFGLGIDKYCDGCICDWGLVWDDINIGDGTRDIMGGTAAPGCVAMQIIFVYWEGGVSIMFYLYLYWDMLKVYLFVWIGLIYDVIRREEGGRGPPI